MIINKYFVAGFIACYIFFIFIIVGYLIFMQNFFLGWFNPMTERFCINTKENPNVEFTMLHEYGHYIFYNMNSTQQKVYCNSLNFSINNACFEYYANIYGNNIFIKK